MSRTAVLIFCLSFGVVVVGCGSRTRSTPPRDPVAISIPPSQESTQEPMQEEGVEPNGPLKEPVGSEVSGPDECDRPGMFGPVQVSLQRFDDRRGARSSFFSEVLTTKEQPLEECGVRGSLMKLLQLTCQDGSNPFANTSEAHGSRAGSLGPGGRCDSIIDLYIVPCPERTYEVYIDMYVCPSE